MANDERIKNLCNHVEAEVRAMVITEQAPVADAQTLEDLARIGRAATQSEGAPKWENLGHITKQMYLTQTAAILRAARPVLDVTADELKGKRLELDVRHGTPDLLAWLNTKIRYRVDPTPAECPTCARVRAALEGEA